MDPPDTDLEAAVAHASEEDALRLVLTVHQLVRDLRRSLPTATLQPTQLIVLTRLMEDGPMRLGELASKVPCSQPTATTVVAGLEPDGLVRREPDAEDRRAVQLTITELGREQITGMARAEATLLKQRIDELDEADRRTLVEAIDVLGRLVSAS